MGDPTGVGLYSQIVSASGLMGMMSGMFTGGSGKLIIDLPANSTHVLTLKNPAMVVAQVVQLNRELAKGNRHMVGSIASRLKTTGANSYSDNIAVGVAGGTRVAQTNSRLGSR